MVTGSPQPAVVTLQGTLRCERVRSGTAGEHESLVLESQGRRLVLSRLGGNPFEVPQDATQWLGRTVTVQGYLLSGELRYLKLQLA